MKLACIRCKRKKIKCDKGEPVCHQCITAKDDCQYVERRQRPRHKPQRDAVLDINHRLRLLEEHVSGTGGQTSPSAPSTLRQTESQERSPALLPDTSLIAADGQDSWVYQLATKTGRNFQNQATPVTTPAPQIGNAMSSLNAALDELGKLKVRIDTINVDFKLQPEESRKFLEAFFELMSAMVVPDIFVRTMDVKLLRALPDIIDSPFVNIDPGVYVLYYNALYYGVQQVNGPGDPLARKAYMKVLENVPPWLEGSKETSMDGYTAALTSWTAIDNHDYPLSWRFHCKSWQWIKARGVDQLDVVPSKTIEEESQRDALRYLYWHVLSTDTLFRLFYGKPTMVRWSPDKIRPPSVFRSGNMCPSAAQVTTCVVWIRYTHMTAEMLNYMEDNAPNAHDESLDEKIDHFCRQLEDLTIEWRLEETMNAQGTPGYYRCLLADLIMNICAIIIGVQRLIQKTSVNNITLRAARKVASIIIEVQNDDTLSESSKTVCNHFITFYPFCAVFSLYEHVLACADPDDCEGDVQALETLGIALAQASAQRRDFMPFARTINALNRVSRTLHDERRRLKRTGEFGENNHGAVPGIDVPSSSFDTFQNLVATELPDFDASAFSSLPDYQTDTQDDLYPLGFVRALENDFVTRNWHGDWWNMSGDSVNPISNTPESGEPAQPQFAYLTPDAT